MAGSVTTTRISLLEIGTDQNYDAEGTLFIPSGSTIEATGVIAASGEITATGNIVATGDVDATAGDILARVDPAHGSIQTGPGGADGAFSFVSHSANSVALVFRSGDTNYIFLNDLGVAGA